MLTWCHTNKRTDARERHALTEQHFKAPNQWMISSQTASGTTATGFDGTVAWRQDATSNTVRWFLEVLDELVAEAAAAERRLAPVASGGVAT